MVFQDSLDHLADNLAFHVNETPQTGTPLPLGSSLSQAHGIDLIAGGLDPYGNITTEYRDSANDRVSDAYTTGKANFVRFIVGGQPYYAPAQTTVQLGQAVTANLLNSAPTVATAPGSSALITDYAEIEQQTAINLDSLFREHLNQPAETAHIVLAVSPSPTYDTASTPHLVATHLIQIQVGGALYAIPCSPRLGGPVQPPRILTNPTRANSYAGEGDPNPKVVFTASCEGMMPILFQWQYSYTPADPASWADITTVTTSANYYWSSLAPAFAIYSADGGFPASGTSTATRLVLGVASNTESGSVLCHYIRCKFSVSYEGTAYSAYTSYAELWASDATGSYLCTLAYTLGLVTEKFYYTYRRCVFKQMPREVIMGYGTWSLPLAAWLNLKQNRWARDPFMALVVSWMKHICYRSGKYPKPNWTGRAILLSVVPVCYLIGLAKTFTLRKVLSFCRLG